MVLPGHLRHRRADDAALLWRGARTCCMAALSSEYQHPKIAIAVDADVDIFNPAEILWALATRVDPDKDVSSSRAPTTTPWTPA